MARALKVEDTRCTSFVRGRPSKCTPSGRHRLAVVAPVERLSPIDIAAGRFGIFFRVFKPERAESLFQPRIQAFLTAPIEQFGKYRIHERFEMVRVTYSGASKGIPDVGEFAVFNAVETNIGHPARLLRSLRTIGAVRVGPRSTIFRRDFSEMPVPASRWRPTRILSRSERRTAGRRIVFAH
jgi:hypothetical protein